MRLITTFVTALLTLLIALILGGCRSCPETTPAESVPQAVRQPAAEWGAGGFLIVPRQHPAEPPNNPYVTTDGLEMVANCAGDDEPTAERIFDALEEAGMHTAGSFGHGHLGIYVEWQRAEEARELLAKEWGVLRLADR